jgi:hypothetical protein
MSDAQVSLYVLAWLLPAAVGLALLARWVYRIGRELWGPHDLDWPTGLVLIELVLPILAALAGVGAVIAYGYALALGALPAWSLAVPAAAVGFAVHRLRLFIAAKRAEQREEAERK